MIFAQEADARLAVEACAVFALNGQLLNIEVVEARAHVPLPMPASAQDAASRWVVGGTAAAAACDCLESSRVFVAWFCQRTAHVVHLLHPGPLFCARTPPSRGAGVQGCSSCLLCL